jgi:hypothetical protein
MVAWGMVSPPNRTALLRRILGVIGAATLAGGCAARPIGEGGTQGEAGEGEGESGTLDSGEASTGMSTGTSGDGDGDGGSADEGSSDTGVKFDIPPPDDGWDTGAMDTGDTSSNTGGDQCGPFIQETWNLDIDPPPECTDVGGFWSSDLVCFWPPDGTSCEDEPYDYGCIIDAYSCGLISGGELISCGPQVSGEGACCYVVVGDCAVGRPFGVGGRARLATLVDDGPPTRPSELELDADTRAALADAWRSHGRSEHASIASFARFSTQLLALGAPARLLAASQRAGADELRHARACFALAARYAGTTPRPSGLEVRGCHTDSCSAVEIASSLAREGCVAETVSLMLLRAAHAQARDAAVRASLAEMIADEERHVLLAWDALAWMCARFGAPVRTAVARVFAEPERWVGFGARTALRGDEAAMRAHGYLSLARRREIAIAALCELVAPAAQALLRAASTSKPAGRVRV